MRCGAVNLGALFASTREILMASGSPSDAWQDIVSLAGPPAYPPLPTGLLASPPAAELPRFAKAIGHALAEEPPPPDITWFLFPITTLWDASSHSAVPVLGLCGGTGDAAEDAPYNNRCSYDNRGFEYASPALAAAHRAGEQAGDACNFYQYWLAFSIAGLLARYATRQLALRQAIYTGFSSGDIARIG